MLSWVTFQSLSGVFALAVTIFVAPQLKKRRDINLVAWKPMSRQWSLGFFSWPCFFSFVSLSRWGVPVSSVPLSLCFELISSHTDKMMELMFQREEGRLLFQVLVRWRNIKHQSTAQRFVMLRRRIQERYRNRKYFISSCDEHEVNSTNLH